MPEARGPWVERVSSWSTGKAAGSRLWSAQRNSGRYGVNRRSAVGPCGRCRVPVSDRDDTDQCLETREILGVSTVEIKAIGVCRRGNQ